MKRELWLWENFLKFHVDDERLSDYKERKIAIWGLGEVYENTRQIFAELNISADVLLDSAKKSLNGASVYHPDYLNEHKDMLVIITVSEKEACQLRKNYPDYQGEILTITEFMFRISRKDWKGLEISPAYNPIFPKGMENVGFFGLCSSNELRTEATIQSDKDAVPDKINYISPMGDLSIIKEKFDCIYSAHVIEHQPNFVKHLQQVESLLTTDGVYLLVVPDKRYCFDYYRPITILSDVLEDYYEDRKFHSLRTHLLEYLETHNDPKKHWMGDHGEMLSLTLERYKSIVDLYSSSMAHHEYINKHSCRFTPESFCNIIHDLHKLKMIKLEVLNCCETQENTFQFYVTLGHTIRHARFNCHRI